MSLIGSLFLSEDSVFDATNTEHLIANIGGVLLPLAILVFCIFKLKK